MPAAPIAGAMVIGACAMGWHSSRAAAASPLRDLPPARATPSPAMPLGTLELLQGLVRPAAIALFEDLRGEVRASATPLPEGVRDRLRPFFRSTSADGLRLDGAVLERATFALDPPHLRPLFELAPAGIGAITLGDVIAFAAGEYRPDCVEGVALIGHELVHVAQFRAFGTERFLDRYFLTETLERLVSGAGTGDAVDPAGNALEVEAYCHQERICRALAATGELPACHGSLPRCTTCPRTAAHRARDPAARAAAHPRRRSRATR